MHAEMGWDASVWPCSPRPAWTLAAFKVAAVVVHSMRLCRLPAARMKIATLALLAAGAVAYDDFHYPSEEPAEQALADAAIPTVSASTSSSWTMMACDGVATGPTNVSIGGTFPCRTCKWVVRAVWQESGPAADTVTHVAVEQEYRRWGIVAFLSSDDSSSPIVLRKAVGSLAGIDQPWFNLSDAYFSNISNSTQDLPSQIASSLTADGEADYPSMAGTLAPQRDTVAISHAADVNKFAVAYSGRVKCGSTGKLGEDSRDGGIAELSDLHAAPPDPQKIVFDPSHYLGFWPRTYGNMKTGLIGGHLGVANVGAFTEGRGGFELIAFSPVPPQEEGGVPPPFPYVPPPPTPPAPPAPWACDHRGPSEEACLKVNSTWTAGHNAKYNGCGTCYCCKKNVGGSGDLPRDLPRLPNINYNPGVFVMLRDQASAASASTVNGSRYFYATNQSTKELPNSSGPAMFYRALLAVQRKDAKILAAGMQVELPSSDRRQVDMANAAILATTNNFVGNQPNYGFGSTYWSYGREDNGSLPLDMLSVDDALISFGICETVLAHIGFYFDNYIAADGTVTYFIPPWGSGTDQTHGGDSIADYGRLIDTYIRAVRFCDAPAAWQRQHLPAVQQIARLLLKLRSKAPKLPHVPPHAPTPCVFGPEQNMTYIAGDSKAGAAETLAAAEALCAKAPDCGGVTQQGGKYTCRAANEVTPSPAAQPSNSWLITNAEACGHSSAGPATGTVATAGLIIGPPEHDFSGDKTHYYYNNNLFSLYAMEKLGRFLISPSTIGQNVTLGKALLADAVPYRKAIARSIAACTVQQPGADPYLPVFAATNTTPLENMHSDRDSSYANFRFYSESMLTGTSILPEPVMQGWLNLHNHKGGRLGGMSRFLDHTDDMPTAGWGYGALINNRTSDFQELLYGHAANYQSRGSFHSTEQLAFTGSGRYRALGSLRDVIPGGPNTLASVQQTSDERSHVASRYNGAETFISFCIVSNILVARMTRWQLVLEEGNKVWLGRGAPKRWFTSQAGGFSVTNAPSSYGRISYNLTVSSSDVATYSVKTSGTTASLPAAWSLRWACNGTAPSGLTFGGCKAISEDLALGIVTVIPSQAAFTVSASC